MTSRNHVVTIMLGAALLIGLVLIAARPTAAQAEPNLYLSPTGRAADDIAYLYMHETTSLQANGDGEEQIEFNIANTGWNSISSTGFFFTVNTTQYWGIKAWDDAGNLPYTVTVEDGDIYVTVYFRNSLPPGGTYRYYFAITFPDLAEQTGDQWRIAWRTRFPVSQFVRTVVLPHGTQISSADPQPTSITNNTVRWERNNITEFEFELYYEQRTLSDQDLVEQFAPYFRLHTDDVYVPMNINLALQHAACYVQEGSNSSVCTLGLLGGAWKNYQDSYIDFHGWPGGGLNEDNSSQRYYVSNIKAQADSAPVVYARVYRVPNSDKKVIQYWLYYYYNSWGRQGGFPGSLHEGDWEMVQVVLDGNNQPRYAAYAQHGELPLYNGGSKKLWKDVEKKDSNHPIVYPARGSHAGYFRSGKYLLNLDVTADESKSFLFPQPAVHLLASESANPWVNYAGLWGQPGKPGGFQDGPTSPGRKGTKWDDPYAWSEKDLDWDEEAEHHKGKARAFIDAPCNVGVQNVQTGQSFGWQFNEFVSGIDGGEYIVNETTGRHSLILHNSYKQPAELYQYVATCSDGVTPSARAADAPVSLTIELYDAGSDELVTATFELPTNWSTDRTIATLAFEEDQTPMLKVDRDNNGSTDQVVPPESVVSMPIALGRVLVPMIAR